MERECPLKHWSISYCQGGGIIPVQYWGEFMNNWKFYFRMRSSWCSLRVGPPTVEMVDLPLVNPDFDREAFDQAFAAGEPYPHPFFWGPIGEYNVYPDDPLVGWFKEEDDLHEAFRICFDQIKQEIGLGDMVCPKCKQDRHDDCRGGTWCDCQHRASYPEVEAEAKARRTRKQ